MLIRNLRTKSGLDNIRLSWDSPKLRPIKFELTFSCRLINGEEYITNVQQILDSTSISVQLGKLRTNSACKLNLLAVYNPASIDPGITVTKNTMCKGTYTNSTMQCYCIYTTGNFYYYRDYVPAFKYTYWGVGT